jgi:hypothetical protein
LSKKDLHEPEPPWSLHLIIILNIDNSLGPLARRHMTVEQDINLTERSVLHLRDEHPGQDGTEESGAGPDVTALAAQVPLVAVQHVAGEENAGDVDQVVGAAADAGGERPEADGGRFADDDP